MWEGTEYLLQYLFFLNKIYPFYAVFQPCILFYLWGNEWSCLKVQVSWELAEDGSYPCSASHRMGGSLSPLGAATLPRAQFPETGQVTFQTTLVSDSLAPNRLIIPLLTGLLFFSCSIKRGNHRDGELPPVKHRPTPRVPQHLVPAHLSSRG